MTEQNIKKIKLLKLMELLREKTDEQNPMVAKDVCKRLADKGVVVDRRVLTHDIGVLNDFGYEIMSTMVGHEKSVKSNIVYNLCKDMVYTLQP